ncbi:MULTISPECIES: hypothetical protein [unclassified Clostridium]|uniref:hypothetical protein n=1 Tax=unclassified Clostridium TaxID=2614128 RepID=UPI0025C30F0A|nr:MULTISPECIES: hypothetical protein [unclassified Clostridium]
MESLDKLFDDDWEGDRYTNDVLKECEQCGKLCPSEDLCKIDGFFGKFIVACPQCAVDMDSSIYMCFNDSDDITYDEADFDSYD